MQGTSILDADDETFPSWGHWHSQAKHLPATFHSKDGFAELERSLKLPLPEQTYHHLERFYLVVGLALQDISKVLLQGDEDEEVVQGDEELVPRPALKCICLNWLHFYLATLSFVLLSSIYQ